MQVDPIKPTFKAPGISSKSEIWQTAFKFGFQFNLRCYTLATAASDTQAAEVKAVHQRVAAVEDEFRWALHEAERERSRLAAAVADGAAASEEMRRVAGPYTRSLFSSM